MTPISGFARPLLLAGLMLLLAGCSTWFGGGKPTPGDRMIAQGEAVADLGEVWNEGSKMVDRADSLAAEGAKLRKRGREKLEEGRLLTERARPIIEEQQRQYARFAAGLGPMATLEAAREQRDHLDRVVRKWRDGSKRLEEGQELMQKGRALIDEGQAKISEADALQLRGHDLMQRAEQTYNSGGTVPAALRE